jgi:hypothetical protein
VDREEFKQSSLSVSPHDTWYNNAEKEEHHPDS